MATATERSTAALVTTGHVPIAYLDANILLPQYLRSVFLDLADAGCIRVHWGRKVLEEVRGNLVKPTFGRTAQQAEDLLRLLTRAFATALAKRWGFRAE
ncbi:MAG: hypothetical protein EPN41_03110 [Candidimonas sp.]|nr:MAG: hypothetical protein EPN41_03110 [Candidimonas sp.]